MNASSIALCIPAYNAASFLPRLLKSALAQTMPFEEIWVYDDCSTDNTGEVAQQFGARVVRGETNLGCSHGKNILAERTTCSWIHFHDADDELYPNFVETAYRYVTQENGPDVVLFDYEWRDDATNELISIRRFDNAQLRRDPINYAIREQINPFCGLYRRSAYLQAGGYDTDPLVLYNEDVMFHCLMAVAGLKFAAESAVTIINYRRENSMSAANQVKCAKAQFQVMRKVAGAVDNQYADEITQRLWNIAGVSAAYLDWENADHCVALATSIKRGTVNCLNFPFNVMCKLNPYLAIRIREKLIRRFKSRFRQLI
jgi:glycosyltransferase involved in cell wall biosynthesis